MLNVCARMLSCLFLLLTLTTRLVAQSTEAEIKTRFQDKQFYLRGFWGDPHLHFGADGSLSVPSDPLSFTVAGVRLKSVKLSKDKLVLKGKRMGLEFRKEGQKWVQVEDIAIEIAKSASGDFTPALNAILTDDFDSLLPSLPSYWQRYKQCKLSSAAASTKLPEVCQPGGKADPSVADVGGSVSAPTMDAKSGAEFNRFARKVKYSGETVFRVIIDETGRPGRLQVISPIGLGLDEQALAAAQNWHFKPALQNGKPVKVEVTMQVDFRIY